MSATGQDIATVHHGANDPPELEPDARAIMNDGERNLIERSLVLLASLRDAIHYEGLRRVRRRGPRPAAISSSAAQIGFFVIKFK
jgi:hypothetical protein